MRQEASIFHLRASQHEHSRRFQVTDIVGAWLLCFAQGSCGLGASIFVAFPCTTNSVQDTTDSPNAQTERTVLRRKLTVLKLPLSRAIQAKTTCIPKPYKIVGYDPLIRGFNPQIGRFLDLQGITSEGHASQHSRQWP